MDDLSVHKMSIAFNICVLGFCYWVKKHRIRNPFKFKTFSLSSSTWRISIVLNRLHILGHWHKLSFAFHLDFAFYFVKCNNNVVFNKTKFNYEILVDTSFILIYILGRPFYIFLFEVFLYTTDTSILYDTRHL